MKNDTEDGALKQSIDGTRPKFRITSVCSVFCHIGNVELDSVELDFRTPSISNWNVSGVLQKCIGNLRPLLLEVYLILILFDTVVK